ncbi:MAG: hypothetical protein B6I18_03530 [Bacteroidetes bacterium 4572_112]|nr:MAG: hypothetical protein B6I18_03530 [Bacteroidetes bacterium 4572_112]
MDNITTHISAFPLIELLLGIIIIFSFLRILKITLLRIVKRAKHISKINRYYSIFELFTWLLYLIWILPHFFDINTSLGIILSLVLVIAILLISWYAGKDFISGFIIKSNTGFKLNARIKTDDFDGVIIEFYSRNLKLLNDDGGKLLIPYSNLIGKNILIKNNDKARTSKHITLKLKSEGNYEELINQLKFKIMMHPKTLVNITPTINIIRQKKDVILVDINISARDSKGLTEIENFLKKDQIL